MSAVFWGSNDASERFAQGGQVNDEVEDAVLLNDVQRLWPGTNEARDGRSEIVLGRYPLAAMRDPKLPR